MVLQFVLLGFIVAASVAVVLWGSKRAVSDEERPDGQIDSPAQPEEVVALDATPDSPVSFGYKICWFAVQATDVDRIISVLGLRDPKPANWESGLFAAYGEPGTAFVSPPLDGWTLVISLSLPDIGGDGRPDSCTPVLLELGQCFPRVCYFGTHSVVDYHAWALVENGRLVRQFAYVGESGETPWDSGGLTQDEEELGLHYNLNPAEGENRVVPNEDDVLAIAASWSLDTTALDGRKSLKGTGMVCEVPEAWL